MPGYPLKFLDGEPLFVDNGAYGSPGSCDNIGSGDFPIGAVKGPDADACLVGAAPFTGLDMPGLAEGLDGDIKVGLGQIHLGIQVIDPQDCSALMIMKVPPNLGPGSGGDFPISKEPARVPGEQHNIILSVGPGKLRWGTGHVGREAVSVPCCLSGLPREGLDVPWSIRGISEALFPPWGDCPSVACSLNGDTSFPSDSMEILS